MAVLVITAANKALARNRAVYIGGEKEVAIILPALGAQSDVEWVDRADTGLRVVTKAWITQIAPTVGAASPVTLAAIPNFRGNTNQTAENGSCGVKSSAVTTAGGVILHVRGIPR